MKPTPNVILEELRKKQEQRDTCLFRRLLVTGPLTRRLDRIAAKLNL